MFNACREVCEVAVLIIYSDGAGEIKDVESFGDVLNGDIVDERVFIDNTIALIRSEDAPAWEKINVAVTVGAIRGTVIFAKSLNEREKYIDLDEKTVDMLLRRFPNIKMKEAEECQKTSLSWLERLTGAIKRLLMAGK